jgi:hypothetical protein
MNQNEERLLADCYVDCVTSDHTREAQARQWVVVVDRYSVLAGVYRIDAGMRAWGSWPGLKNQRMNGVYMLYGLYNRVAQGRTRGIALCRSWMVMVTDCGYIPQVAFGHGVWRWLAEENYPYKLQMTRDVGRSYIPRKKFDVVALEDRFHDG